ncbi:MAG: DnaD domain protein [Lachnospiraceae bacterium]|nr:DnaD domain protein [Lachnospiraceae bacterium]
MSGLKLEAEERIETTQISNLFIDRYMPRANGEYIKIYLLLLRQIQTPKWELSVSSMADYLECTEKDVRRGLAYWEREGVLSLRFDPQKKLSGIMLLDLQAKVAAAAEIAAGRVKAEEAATRAADEAAEETVTRMSHEQVGKDAAADARKEPVKPLSETRGSGHDMSRLSHDEAFSQLIGVASAYKRKPLSHEDCNILAYLYDTLGMSSELLEYLVESCVEGGITSVRTMEKIALGWHERGITTPEQAEAMQTIYRQDMWKIMKAFGLSGRNPGNSEKKMMEKWLMQYGFDTDVILDACDRTMRQIQKPSFEYTDRILKSWKDSGVRTRKDIEAMETAARAAKSEKTEASRTEKTVRPTARPNRFHNYQQRNTDYDSLIAQHDPLTAGSAGCAARKNDED